MSALTSQKCVPCQGGEPVLSKREIDEYLKELKYGWKYEPNPDKIVNEFNFKDFVSAIGFVNEVAKLAQQEDHHPNIYVHDFKKVRIELWTHKINGLHKNDFILASKIEGL